MYRFIVSSNTLWSAVYFLLFFFFVGMIVLNLISALVVEAMETISESQMTALQQQLSEQEQNRNNNNNLNNINNKDARPKQQHDIRS